jgi:hypothetical protein
MIDDTTFELDLRAMLAARDPGPPGLELAFAVRARLENDHESPRLLAVPRLAATAASLAAIVAVLILAIVVARPSAVGPGATALPSPAVPYAFQPGDGVVKGDDYPVAQLLGALVLFSGLGRVLALSKIRWRRASAGLGIVILILVAATIGTSDAIGFGGFSAMSPVRSGPAEIGSGDLTGTYVDVTGDSPFRMLLTVTNTSLLPLELEGIPEATIRPGTIAYPRFVGLAVPAEPSLSLSAMPIPFAPVTLEPGASIDLALLGLGGQCTISPTDPSTAGRTWIDHVDIVYEQMTIRHSASVALAEPIYFSEPDHCP